MLHVSTDNKKEETHFFSKPHLKVILKEKLPPPQEDTLALHIHDLQIRFNVTCYSSGQSPLPSAWLKMCHLCCQTLLSRVLSYGRSSSLVTMMILPGKFSWRRTSAQIRDAAPALTQERCVINNAGSHDLQPIQALFCTHTHTHTYLLPAAQQCVWTPAQQLPSF